MAKIKVENRRRQKVHVHVHVLTAYGMEVVSHFFLAVVDASKDECAYCVYIRWPGRSRNKAVDIEHCAVDIEHCAVDIEHCALDIEHCALDIEQLT